MSGLANTVSDDDGARSAWPLIEDIAKEVTDSKFGALRNVNEALKRLKETSDFNHSICLLEDSAVARAKQIDNRLSRGEDVGVLAGVPFVAKDNFLVLSGQTTAASKILENFEAPYQATAINKLEAAGAICVAKANLDAFAHGSSTENSDFMVTKNPHDKSRVPGGSSGGSAAVVALGCVPFALGSDTGGSIRQPASLCGIVGYKPTYGLISRSGVVAMASSTDCIGAFTTNSRDMGVVIDVMAGKDPLDSTTIEREDSYRSTDKASLKGLKIGLVSEYMKEGLEPIVKEKVLTSIDKLRAAGAEIIDISLPSLPLALAVYYIVVPAEVSSNLARYDGQRYGYSNADAKSLEDSYSLSRSQGFGAEAKRRIMIGTYVLSSGYYDAYYKKAQTVRTKLIKEFNDAFTKIDLLVGPTTPSQAFKIGENTDNPLQMYLSDIMTVSANLVGVPAISLPLSVSAGQLPVGLQLMAPQKQDAKLLKLSKLVEKEI